MLKEEFIKIFNLKKVIVLIFIFLILLNVTGITLLFERFENIQNEIDVIKQSQEDSFEEYWELQQRLAADRIESIENLWDEYIDQYEHYFECDAEDVSDENIINKFIDVYLIPLRQYSNAPIIVQGYMNDFGPVFLEPEPETGEYDFLNLDRISVTGGIQWNNTHPNTPYGEGERLYYDTAVLRNGFINIQVITTFYEPIMQRTFIESGDVQALENQKEIINSIMQYLLILLIGNIVLGLFLITIVVRVLSILYDLRNKECGE